MKKQGFMFLGFNLDFYLLCLVCIAT